jgi:chaperone modulatory protein CbpM
MDSGEFLLRTRLDAQALETWIAAGWLVPRPRGELRDFSDIDVARASLILDLRRLGVNDEGIPVVLDLIDQVHGLRRMMRRLLVAMHVRSDAALRPADDLAASACEVPDDDNLLRAQPRGTGRKRTH